MSDLIDRYFDAAETLLRRVRTEEREAIAAAAERLADTVAAGGRLFAAGAGHSGLVAQDVVYRSGGLVLFNLLRIPGATGIDVVPAPLTASLERVSGLAAAVLDASPLRRGDVLVMISLSGRNALPVELAMGARERGATVIGLTSRAYLEGSTPSNPTGTFLAEHCDLVVDTKVAVGDAELTADGVSARFASASTLVATAALQAIVAAAVGLLGARGQEPPTFRSGNVDGGREWNQRQLTEHADRIFYEFPG